MQAQITQPDIEIYIKDISIEMIEQWLCEIFGPVSLPKTNGKPINLKVGTEPELPLMITPNAAGKAFTSIWFQSDQTPWQSDETCAQAFLAFHDGEVRCSATSWQEEEDESSEQWLCMTRNEKRLIRWG